MVLDMDKSVWSMLKLILSKIEKEKGKDRNFFQNHKHLLSIHLRFYPTPS
jgi:hypothetical protein